MQRESPGSAAGAFRYRSGLCLRCETDFALARLDAVDGLGYPLEKLRLDSQEMRFADQDVNVVGQRPGQHFVGLRHRVLSWTLYKTR